MFFEHDSRDNFFTASRGWKGYLEAMFYSPDFGSDGKYEIYRANAFGYWPLSKQLVLGGRVDTRAARGDVPFYQLPFIEMRGIPVAATRTRTSALVEAELRWNVTRALGADRLRRLGPHLGLEHEFQRRRHGERVGRRLPPPDGAAARHLHGRRPRARPRGDGDLHPGRQRLAIDSYTRRFYANSDNVAAWCFSSRVAKAWARRSTLRGRTAASAPTGRWSGERDGVAGSPLLADRYEYVCGDMFKAGPYEEGFQKGRARKPRPAA